MTVQKRLQRISAFDTLAATDAMMLAAGAKSKTTRLAASWREPSSGPSHFQKTLVVFVTSDEALRRTVEDRLAARIPNGVPAYRVLSSSTTADNAAVQTQVRELGFDGAVVMRVVDVDSRVRYVPGRYWHSAPDGGFDRFWENAWSSSYDPSYLVQDKVVSVEAQAYSLTRDQLIWAGRSETTHPKSASTLVDTAIDRIVDAIQKDVLVAQPSADDRACARAVAS